MLGGVAECLAEQVGPSGSIQVTRHLTAWYRLFERLRDTELFTTPYFRLVRIVTCVEDGYRGYEKTLEAR